jgi:hypothetical protein
MHSVSDFRWEYLADTVMGGVSEGQARLSGSGDAAVLTLSGTVSTANRGGFIQARTMLAVPLSPQARALRLKVRGNGEGYFVHLRSAFTRMPWQFYQSGFDTGPDWREVTLPFDGFRPSGGGRLPDPLAPETLRSIGLVACGRDHLADLSVAALGVL